MRRQSPGPTSLASVSSLLDARVSKAEVPPSPSYSFDSHPYSPSVYSRIDPSDNQRGFDNEFVPPLPTLFRHNTQSDAEEDDDEKDDRHRHPFTEPGLEPDDDSTSRLSVMGPKMKMFSKAPWEVGSAGILEEEEPMDDTTDSISVHGWKKPRDRGRTITKATDESKSWMPFGKARSREPMVKDTISSPVPIRHSHDEPQSPSMFLSSSYNTPQKINHFRPRFISAATEGTRTGLLTPSSSMSVAYPSVVPSSNLEKHSTSIPSSPDSPTFPRLSASGPGSPTIAPQSTRDSFDDVPHPYANPEVFKSSSSKNPYPSSPSKSYLFTSKVAPSPSEAMAAYVRSDSSTTIKKAAGALPPLTPLSTSISSSVPFPNTSQQPISPRRPNGSFDLSGMQAFPGSPAYKLISLEEARDIRNRTKSHVVPTSSKVTHKIEEPRKLSDVNMSNSSSFRKAWSQTSLVTQLSSTSLSSANPLAQPETLIGESPPLPPLPTVSSGVSSATVPGAPGSATAAPVKTIKPKRSGFLRMFDREKNRGMGDQFIPVPLPGRSISSLMEMGVSVASPSEASSRSQGLDDPETLPPMPPIPARYRQESRPAVLESDIVGARSKSLPEPSLRSQTAPLPSFVVPSVLQSTEPFPAVPTKTAEKLSWLNRKPNSLVSEQAVREELELSKLEVRPVSSLFSSMDLVLQPETGDSDIVVGKGEIHRSANAPKKRPSALNIGIPPNPHLDPSSASDYYSPLSASSLSSTFSRSVTESTPGPYTPRSVHGGVLSPLSQTHPSSAPPSSSNSKSSSSSASSTPHDKSTQDFEQRLLVEQNKLVQARKAWQLQKWEYEAQIRNLEVELEESRAEPCSNCNAFPTERRQNSIPKVNENDGGESTGVLDRPRPKTRSVTNSAYSVG